MLQSSLIGKVEKATRYAQEKDRVALYALTATFQGEHSKYYMEYGKGQWRCSCHSFVQHRLCSHTMAVEKILGEMLLKQTTEEET